MDWDAARYHRISEPQFEWGRRVLERLRPRAGERILDVGCGTGRLTVEILRATGRVVVGADRSRPMLGVAADHGGGGRRPVWVQADARALPFDGVFDAVFSAATLHWVHDHDAVWASVFRALRPGGRFVAQCGGDGNLDRLLARAARLMAAPPYAPFFEGWQEPWRFADPAETARGLRAAGFAAVDTSIEPAPTRLRDREAYLEFVSCVCIRHHLDRLPADARERFAGELADLAAADDPPFVLDYQRLNMGAGKPAA